MNEAQRSGQPVVLAVGMKGLGWPEFYVPASALPAGGLTQGQDAASDASLRDATLAFVYETVTRYRDHSTLISWQGENEPFNRAGPQRVWIDAAFLRDGLASVGGPGGHPRAVSRHRVQHFHLHLDQASGRQGV